MRKTKYTVKPTTQFKKDYKLAMKRRLKIELLENVVAALAMGEPLPENNKKQSLIAHIFKNLTHRVRFSLLKWSSETMS